MAGFKAGPPELLHLSLLNFLFDMEGDGAASVGDSVSSNPYIDGTLESDLWLSGWTVRSAYLRHPEPVAPMAGVPPGARHSAGAPSRASPSGGQHQRRA